jgi:PilZ domain
MTRDFDPLSPPDAVGPERRCEPRFEVVVRIVGPVAGGRVRVVNVSDSGCLVFASCLLRTGDVHTFRFQVAPYWDQVTFEARAVHTIAVTGDPETACVAGLEFVGDSPSQRAAVERLIAASAS